jgi:uncharacterized RDD family membrane protein YckC
VPPGGWAPPPGTPAAGAPGPYAPVGGPQAGPFGPPSSYVASPGYGYPGAAVKAGFWARFAAYLIDSIVVGLFGIPARIALETGSTTTERCSIDRSGNVTVGGELNGICEVPTGTTWAIFAVLTLAALIGGVIYYAKLEGRSGQTLGKMALGIKVVDAHTGGSIGIGRGVGRYFARILSALVCFLGYFWMLWDPEKQTWHDKMTTSYVVKA